MVSSCTSAIPSVNFLNRMSKESNTQLNQSLIDGIATLQELALTNEPIGSRELARRLNMDTTRVNRLLRTLEFMGIARRNQKRKYLAGPGMHVLAAQSLFASGLLRSAIDPLKELRKFGYMVAMGVIWRDHVSYLVHALPGMDFSEGIGRIGLYPASSGGVGLALLASQTDQNVIDIYQHHTDIPNCPGGLDELLDKLDFIRKQGYANLATEEKNSTVAVSVGTPAICAIGLSGWIPESAVVELHKELRAVAEVIESHLK